MDDLLGHDFDADAYGKVLPRPLGLRPPKLVVRDTDFAHAVMFYTIAVHTDISASWTDGAPYRAR